MGDRACGHHGCVGERPQPLLTVPTIITGIRTLGAVALIAASIDRSSVSLLFVGLAVYWVGDIADGVVARMTDTETRTGAVLDVLCDRLCVACFYIAYAELHHAMLLPVAVFLVQFMVIDNYLSLMFLHWPLLSPNYFGLVDRRVYALNWSPAGKAVNSGALVIVMVLTHSAVAATVLVVAVAVVKVYSLVRLHRLPVPHPGGCVAAPAPEAGTPMMGTPTVGTP